jgi:hypothetical protein
MINTKYDAPVIEGIGRKLFGGGLGGAAGALGHKLVGGKEENRGKAGMIGAGIGGHTGAALPNIWKALTNSSSITAVYLKQDV